MFSTDDDDDWEAEAPLPFKEKPAERSEDRYEARRKLFEGDGRPYPRLRHYGFWWLHNCVVHPLLGLFPSNATVQFHALSSAWLNHIEGPFLVAKEMLGMKVPEIGNRRMWVWHNLISHVLIGIVPCSRTFAGHDETAKKMNVPGWV